MDYNLGLLSDPDELRRLLAAAQVQPEDRSGANMQALLAFGAALMGAKKGQEFDALSRGAIGGLAARNNALETAREGRSRTLVNAGMGQEILARGRKMKQEDEDRAAAIADQQEFSRLFAGNAPDVAPMANGKGPTVENAAAQAPVPNEVRQYRAMAQYYAMRRNGDMAKKMNDIADSLEEKYSQTPQAVRLPDGRIAYAQFGNKGGRKVAEGISPAEKLHFANTGDKAAVGFDQYSGTQVSGGAAVNMSPSEKDASARGWTNINIAREQMNRGAENTASGKVGELRKEFNALPQVKAFTEVAPVLQSARDAAGVDTAAADLNLIYAAAKIMDPTSVVRESETTMVVNTGSPAQKYVGMFNHIAGGGRLTAQTRSALMREIESRAKGYETSYTSARRAYEGIATKNNIPHDQVFIEVAPPAAQNGKTVVRTGTEKGTGRKVIQYSDGTIAYQ